MGEAFLQTQQEAIVLCSHAGLEILYHVRAADHGVENLADGSPDNEVSAVVVQIIHAQDKRSAKLPLNTDVHLLNHWILHAIVDDVNATRSGARKNEPGKRIRKGRSSGRKLAQDRIEREL